MKILFICSCLEKGKDGVGDYTRLLAAKLNSIQHIKTSIIALNDTYLNEWVLEEQQDEIEVLRISARHTYQKKHKFLEDYIHKLNPDIVSLQFVPYAFHDRGMPYQLPYWLSKLQVKKWHIMFHELWIGMEKRDSVKSQLIGLLQKHIIKKTLAKLKPKHIHTSNGVYFYYLKTLFNKEHLSILPLFSNITNKAFEEKNCLPLSLFNIILFGSLHHGAPVKDFLNWLSAQLKVMGLTPYFTFVGNNGEHLIEWTNELNNQNISYQSLSFQTEENIALLLRDAQLGITTTPYFLSDKSGTVAAMTQYKLPILSVARNWLPNVSKDVLKQLEVFSCTKWSANLQLKKILIDKPTFNSFEEICNLFIKNLQ